MQSPRCFVARRTVILVHRKGRNRPRLERDDLTNQLRAVLLERGIILPKRRSVLARHLDELLGFPVRVLDGLFGVDATRPSQVHEEARSRYDEAL